MAEGALAFAAAGFGASVSELLPGPDVYPVSARELAYMVVASVRSRAEKAFRPEKKTVRPDWPLLDHHPEDRTTPTTCRTLVTLK